MPTVNKGSVILIAVAALAIIVLATLSRTPNREATTPNSAELHARLAKSREIADAKREEQRKKPPPEELQKLRRGIMEAAGKAGARKWEIANQTLRIQWDELQWRMLPYDDKRQALQLMQAAYPEVTLVRVNGYRSGKELASAGYGSVTIEEE